MEENSGELVSRVISAQSPSDVTPPRREWQPPKGEIVEVATGTLAGVGARDLADGTTCHS
jgi:hypothetical protein